jgi:hypothetical protein
MGWAAHERRAGSARNVRIQSRGVAISGIMNLWWTTRLTSIPTYFARTTTSLGHASRSNCLIAESNRRATLATSFRDDSNQGL